MSEWDIYHGDCIPYMATVMDPYSVDMAVFSPPFPSLYAYTSEDADIGNTATCDEEARVHLSFFYRALARVHIPVTEIERPMIDNVLRKASRVQADTEMQEAMFLDHWSKS